MDVGDGNWAGQDDRAYVRTDAAELFEGLDGTDASGRRSEQSHGLAGQDRREAEVFDDELHGGGEGAVVLGGGEDDAGCALHGLLQAVGVRGAFTCAGKPKVHLRRVDQYDLDLRILPKLVHRYGERLAGVVSRPARAKDGRDLKFWSVGHQFLRVLARLLTNIRGRQESGMQVRFLARLAAVAPSACREGCR